ncbi:MAG: DUF342 domain-containing protein [Sedimentibacter sp.]
MDNLNDITQNLNVNEDAHTEELQPKYIITHLVSANRLKAYIRIELIDKQSEVNYQDILDYLSEQGIVYGIREEEIKEYCSLREYSKELVAAIGKEPINGQDAQLIYDFDISKENKFIENKNGIIDFRNLNNVINVTKDTVLCHIIPAQIGEDGVDVYGQPINYKPGKNVSFNHGNNTYISNDNLKILASTDGCVEFKNNKVYVENIYRVNNVDNATGNIDFIGSVVIGGDVKAGFSVTAKGDIKIRGMVEGAFIKSDGDVAISKGMNGMGTGSIIAKGNITSKYIENATIETEKTVYAEALINSDVKAGDSIILRGSTAAIIGGISQAENIIYAKTVGSKTNPETNLIITLTKYQEEQKLIAVKKRLNHQLEKDLFTKNKELREIEEKVELIMNSSLDNENKNAVQKQLLFMKIRINNDISEIKRQLTEIIPTHNIMDYKIIFRGIMYSNTRITIGWMKYRVRQDISYSKMYNDGNDISIVPLNPADLEI